MKLNEEWQNKRRITAVLSNGGAWDFLEWFVKFFGIFVKFREWETATA